MSKAANDNQVQLVSSIDLAVAGQALTIKQPHRKFGQAYAEFVSHAGDGKHVLVCKLISSMWKSRWTKPLKVERALILSVHTRMAQVA
jgi:regulator of RNase E activity RraA